MEGRGNRRRVVTGAWVDRQLKALRSAYFKTGRRGTQSRGASDGGDGAGSAEKPDCCCSLHCIASREKTKAAETEAVGLPYVCGVENERERDLPKDCPPSHIRSALYRGEKNSIKGEKGKVLQLSDFFFYEVAASLPRRRIRSIAAESVFSAF